jgi:hypothetical protein
LFDALVEPSVKGGLTQLERAPEVAVAILVAAGTTSPCLSIWC